MAINYKTNSTPFEEVFIPRSYTFLDREYIPAAFNTNLFSAGDSSYQCLGYTVTIGQSTKSYAQVGSLSNWINVSGGTNVLAVKYNNELWAWGRNDGGQIGDGTVTHRSLPVQIGSLTDWSTVSVGSAGTSYAIKTDGSLWAWGKGNLGSLGDSTLIHKSSPVQIGSLTNWTEVKAGVYHAIAVKSDNSLWAWGEALNGALGDGTVVNKSSPVQIGILTNWAKIYAGPYISGAIKTDGTIWGWGSNTRGSVGDNTVVHKSSPVQVGALTNWKSAAKSGNGTHAIKTDGTLWGWGNNTNGEIGDGTVVHKSSPVQVGSLSNWKILSRSSGSDVAATVTSITTDGYLWSWGNNNGGPLGQNDFVHRSSPTQVGSLNTWKSLAEPHPFQVTIAMSSGAAY